MQKPEHQDSNAEQLEHTPRAVVPAIGGTVAEAAAGFFRANPPELEGMPDLGTLAFALSRLSRAEVRADRAYTWALLLDAQTALGRLMAAELEHSGNAPRAATTLPAPGELDYRLGIAVAAELLAAAVDSWKDAPGDWVQGVTKWLEAVTEAKGAG